MMYMPAFQAKNLLKGVSDETEVSDLQGILAGRSRWSHGDRPRYPEMCGQRGPLMRGDQSLLDIAIALNFSSQANFTRAFRLGTDMTPGQFRRDFVRC
jgi:AraC-like DNA-binding protein